MATITINGPTTLVFAAQQPSQIPQPPQVPPLAMPARKKDKPAEIDVSAYPEQQLAAHWMEDVEKALDYRLSWTSVADLDLIPPDPVSFGLEDESGMLL